MVQLGAKAQLADHNCAVDVVDMGEKAVDKITSGQHKYDLVLMDNGLQCIDGFTATEQIRAWETEQGFDQEQRVTIVAFTAHADRASEKRCYKVGMQDVVLKPNLCQRSEEILGKWVYGTVPVETLVKPNKIVSTHATVIDWAEGIHIARSRKCLLELLHDLHKEMPSNKKKMQDCFDAHDFSGLYEIGRYTLGGVAYCGLPGLRQSLKGLLDALKPPQMDNIPVLFEHVMIEIQAFECAIEELGE
jgi:CheY-like chemotaxis protein